MQQTLHTSPAPAGWRYLATPYTLWHWFASSYETFSNIDSILYLRVKYNGKIVLTMLTLSWQNRGETKVEPDAAMSWWRWCQGGAKVRVSASVAWLQRRQHEMVPLLLLAAAAALALAVSAAGTLTGNSGGAASAGEGWGSLDQGETL